MGFSRLVDVDSISQTRAECKGREYANAAGRRRRDAKLKILKKKIPY
jgi:hypothetical protein